MDDFGALYYADYNLKDISVMHQRWKEGVVFRMNHPRKTSCFLYFRDCSGVYTTPDGREMTVPRGSVVFIPAGTTYTTRFTDKGTEEISTTLIEFNLVSPDGEEFTVGKDVVTVNASGPAPASLFDEMVSVYAATVVPHSVLKALLYRMLSEFSGAEHENGAGRRALQKILPCIPYMESYCDEKTVREIADVCHVSESSFRRLFKQYSGVGPVEYRTRVKTEYAKNLLRENKMTVAEIAETLNYNDPAYFCRVFKKVTGLTPGEYASLTGIHG